MSQRNKYKYCPICATKLKTKMIEGRKRKQCLKCCWINYLNPVPATASLLKEKDKVLVVTRGIEPCKDMLALPGGYMELGETPEDSALREMYEETGIEGKFERLIGVYSQKSSQFGSVLVLGYLVRKTGGSLRPGSDVSAVEYMKPDIEKIAFESHRKILREETC